MNWKLQELASRINLPQCTLAREGSSTGLRSSVQDQVPSVSSTTPKEQNKSFCSDLSSDKLDSMHNSHYCSSDDPVLNMNQQLQVSHFIMFSASSITVFSSSIIIDIACQLYLPSISQDNNMLRLRKGMLGMQITNFRWFVWDGPNIIYRNWFYKLGYLLF